MILTMNLLWLALVVLLVYRNVQSNKMLVPKVDDKDDVIALLESAKTTGSPLADKLLRIAQADEQPDVASTKWDLFVDDMDLEETDTGRFNCLRRWVAGGETFNAQQIVAVTAMFEGVEMRDGVRELLHRALPVNIGRAQAVVEATCGCGARATMYDISIDSILTASCADSSHKFFETGVKVYDGLIVKKGDAFSLLTRSGFGWAWTALKEKS